MKSITCKDTAYMDENRLVRSLVSLHHASYHGTLRLSHSLDADEQGNDLWVKLLSWTAVAVSRAINVIVLLGMSG